MTRRRERSDDLLELRMKDGARKFADLSRAVTTAFESQQEAAIAPLPADASGSDIPEVPKWPERSSASHPAASAEFAGSVEDFEESGDESPVDGEALLREASLKNRKAEHLRRAAEQFHRENQAESEDHVSIPSVPQPGKSIQLPEELKSFCRWVGRLGLSLAGAALEGGRFAASTLATYVLRHPVHFVFNVAIVLAALVLLATGATLNDELISLKLGDRTATEISAASRFTRNYSLTDIEKRGTRAFMRVGAPAWIQHESIKAIIDGARSAGLSLEHQAVLLATAEIESGFNPTAQAATTSACGIFQFIKSTGATFGLKNSDCLDPWKSTEAEIAHYKQNYAKRIEERVVEVKGPEKLLRMFELSYYLHHDGPLSNDPSDGLKATVLAGTPFLFKVYDVLQADDELRSLEPTFFDRFKDRFGVVVARAKVVPGQMFGPVIAWMRPVADETDAVLGDVKPAEGGTEASGASAPGPVSAAKSVPKAAAKPVAKAAPKPPAKPAVEPVAKAASKPPAKPAAAPAAKPATPPAAGSPPPAAKKSTADAAPTGG